VQEAMTPDVRYAFEDDDVQRAADIMKEHQIRRLPVVNREQQLVGIVALGDLATTGQDQLSGDALEQISQPSHAQPS
jgi:CBS-domain-containing membrane protein